MQIKGSWGCCADDCKFQHHFCWVYWFLSHGVVMIGSMPTRKKRYIHVEPCNGLALCLVGIHLMRVQPKKKLSEETIASGASCSPPQFLSQSWDWPLIPLGLAQTLVVWNCFFSKTHIAQIKLWDIITQQLRILHVHRWTTGKCP